MPTVLDAGLVGERRRAVLLASVFTLLFVGSAVYFGSLQNIWVDETTQLSGASLSPGRLIAWLTGRVDPHFGVPPDRMPPISYLLDAACAHSLCTQPFHFRLFHLSFAALGIATIIWLAFRYHGARAAALTGAFLVLSPKLIEQTVEIRAYPIFFLITCLQINLVYRISEQGRLRRAHLAWFAFLSLASIYTHFFGLVSSMALLGGLLLPRMTDRREALMLVGTGALVLLGATGTIPFITAATSFSGAEAPDASMEAYGTYAVRLIGYSANWIAVVPAFLYPAAVGLLLIIAGVRVSADVRRDGWQFWKTAPGSLIIALGAGLAVTLVSSLVASNFNSLKPQYSLWMFPIVALLLGVAVKFPASSGPAKWLGGISAAALLVAAAWAETIFLSNARWFVHGPADAIAAEIERAAAPAAVVYRGEFGWGYFPTYYRFRDRVPQWFMDDRGAVHRVLLNGKVDSAIMDPPTAFSGRKIILADIQRETYLTMRLLYAGVDPEAVPIAAGPAPLIKGWEVASSHVVPEFYWTRLTVYEPVEG